VTPRASRDKVGGKLGDALRVAVSEAPVDGAANRACTHALADAFGVRRGAVEVDAGSKHRRKKVRVHGGPAALTRRLTALAAP
jgi:uncharacterized protein YggU (UPF0235/DUF167 family)